MIKSILMVTISTFSFTAFAQSEYKEAGSCGSATVISGDTCSNVKVLFKFDGCHMKSQPQHAHRIVCEQNTIKARIHTKDHRYEAQFEKTSDSSGGVTWRALGGVKQYVTHFTTSSPVALAHEDEPNDVAPSLRTQASDIASHIQLSAFIDFRNSAVDPDAGNSKVATEHSGYLLEDGAIYLKYAKENLEAMIDLPFKRNSVTTTDSADFAFATSKAQAFATYSFSENYKLVFGQFDTIFGFELNDSKDRLFGNAGLVYAQTLPVVHSGAYFQYSQNGFTAKLLSANPSDRETLGTAKTDSNYEAGVTVGYANDKLRGQLGYMTRSLKDTAGESANRTLTDILFGMTLGPVDIDAEYAIVDNPQKDTLTASDTDSEDAGTGVMVIAAYKATDKIKLGFRYEALDKDPGATSYYKASSFGGVLHYIVNENFTARLEWVDINTDTRAAFSDASGEDRLDIGALLVF